MVLPTLPTGNTCIDSPWQTEALTNIDPPDPISVTQQVEEIITTITHALRAMISEPVRLVQPHDGQQSASCPTVINLRAQRSTAPSMMASLVKSAAVFARPSMCASH